jgi:RNA recognition motif-containing protein
MKKLYVSNLPFSATEEQIRELFGKHGAVHSVSVSNDRETGRFRGFGYVEIEDSGFEKALKLDGVAVDGRPLRVNEAREQIPASDGEDTSS